ncbi:hypothetical protein K488DRAFT_86951 [Vararia minispora EC-137]|uniref:Uncharacterized protein n=1 Tax=Vararia minispora EC-137 TaxID=1314806 RepID=A0ACB8QI36_9AGAM|nr:hypothetical protein K488DRAFT_86951 [Vararia minispora EC-137]
MLPDIFTTIVAYTALFLALYQQPQIKHNAQALIVSFFSGSAIPISPSVPVSSARVRPTEATSVIRLLSATPANRLVRVRWDMVPTPTPIAVTPLPTLSLPEPISLSTPPLSWNPALALPAGSYCNGLLHLVWLVAFFLLGRKLYRMAADYEEIPAPYQNIYRRYYTVVISCPHVDDGSNDRRKRLTGPSSVHNGSGVQEPNHALDSHAISLVDSETPRATVTSDAATQTDLMEILVDAPWISDAPLDNCIFNMSPRDGINSLLVDEGIPLADDTMPEDSSEHLADNISASSPSDTVTVEQMPLLDEQEYIAPVNPQPVACQEFSIESVNDDVSTTISVTGTLCEDPAVELEGNEGVGSHLYTNDKADDGPSRVDNGDGSGNDGDDDDDDDDDDIFILEGVSPDVIEWGNNRLARYWFLRAVATARPDLNVTYEGIREETSAPLDSDVPVSSTDNVEQPEDPHQQFWWTRGLEHAKTLPSAMQPEEIPPAATSSEEESPVEALLDLDDDDEPFHYPGASAVTNNLDDDPVEGNIDAMPSPNPHGDDTSREDGTVDDACEAEGGQRGKGNRQDDGLNNATRSGSETGGAVHDDNDDAVDETSEDGSGRYPGPTPDTSAPDFCESPGSIPQDDRDGISRRASLRVDHVDNGGGSAGDDDDKDAVHGDASCTSSPEFSVALAADTSSQFDHATSPITVPDGPTSSTEPIASSSHAEGANVNISDQGAPSTGPASQGGQSSKTQRLPPDSNTSRAIGQATFLLANGWLYPRHTPTTPPPPSSEALSTFDGIALADAPEPAALYPTPRSPVTHSSGLISPPPSQFASPRGPLTLEISPVQEQRTRSPSPSCVEASVEAVSAMQAPTPVSPIRPVFDLISVEPAQPSLLPSPIPAGEKAATVDGFSREPLCSYEQPPLTHETSPIVATESELNVVAPSPKAVVPFAEFCTPAPRHEEDGGAHPPSLGPDVGLQTHESAVPDVTGFSAAMPLTWLQLDDANSKEDTSEVKIRPIFPDFLVIPYQLVPSPAGCSRKRRRDVLAVRREQHRRVLRLVRPAVHIRYGGCIACVVGRTHQEKIIRRKFKRVRYIRILASEVLDYATGDIVLPANATMPGSAVVSPPVDTWAAYPMLSDELSVAALLPAPGLSPASAIPAFMFGNQDTQLTSFDCLIPGPFPISEPVIAPSCHPTTPYFAQPLCPPTPYAVAPSMFCFSQAFEGAQLPQAGLGEFGSLIEQLCTNEGAGPLVDGNVIADLNLQMEMMAMNGASYGTSMVDSSALALPPMGTDTIDGLPSDPMSDAYAESFLSAPLDFDQFSSPSAIDAGNTMSALDAAALDAAMDEAVALALLSLSQDFGAVDDTQLFVDDTEAAAALAQLDFSHIPLPAAEEPWTADDLPTPPAPRRIVGSKRVANTVARLQGGAGDPEVKSLGEHAGVPDTLSHYSFDFHSPRPRSDIEERRRRIEMESRMQQAAGDQPIFTTPTMTALTAMENAGLVSRLDPCKPVQETPEEREALEICLRRGLGIQDAHPETFAAVRGLGTLAVAEADPASIQPAASPAREDSTAPASAADVSPSPQPLPTPVILVHPPMPDSSEQDPAETERPLKKLRPRRES